MASRILLLLLIIGLALPLTAPFPGQASPQVREQTAPVLAAKKKDRKPRPKVKTVTRIVRQPVVQTFTNFALIAVPDADSGGPAPATPYPAINTVTGFVSGTILDVDVILHGFTWAEGFPQDADILLAATHLPANALVLSNVGGFQPVSNLTLILDDEAATGLPSVGPLESGTFQPTNVDAGFGDQFPAPAPPLSGTSALSVFDGGDPNGTWQLYVVDELGNVDPGSIAGGWSLRITAEADIQVQEHVKKIKKTKKKRRGGR